MFEDGRIRSWLIRAEYGWIAPDNELIRLGDGVSITRPASSGKMPVAISTRNLLIRPEQEIVETADPVRMTTPNGVAEAVGLKADLKKEHLELLAKVRASYELPKP